MGVDLLTRYLTRDGYRVVATTSGAEGLRLARDLRPTVIVLDVVLPDRDGWSVLSALKADPDVADIPVVMVTILDDRNRGYALGAADYLVKPIDPGRLVGALRRYWCGSAPCSVLIVEDHSAVREMMGRALARAGWRVAEAADGRAALEVLTRARPDLILLDLMMPRMDGFAFAAALREDPRWRSIPVVVITAKELTAEDRRDLHGRVQRVYEKSQYSRGELLREVRDLVAGCVASRDRP
jgi:CheY-like chemotaxis protein